MSIPAVHCVRGLLEQAAGNRPACVKQQETPVMLDSMINEWQSLRTQLINILGDESEVPSVSRKQTANQG